MVGMPGTAQDAWAAPEHDALVTVVIPVWGEGYLAHLADAIDSAHQSSARAVEVLVVDNANTPPLRALGATVLRLPTRQTLGQARNLGLAAVTTPYVVFLDADDTLLPNAVDAALVNVGPGVVAVAPRLVDTLGQACPWPKPWMRAATRWPRVFALVEATTAAFATVLRPPPRRPLADHPLVPSRRPPTSSAKSLTLRPGYSVVALAALPKHRDYAHHFCGVSRFASTVAATSP